MILHWNQGNRWQISWELANLLQYVWQFPQWTLCAMWSAVVFTLLLIVGSSALTLGLSHPLLPHPNINNCRGLHWVCLPWFGYNLELLPLTSPLFMVPLSSISSIQATWVINNSSLCNPTLRSKAIACLELLHKINGCWIIWKSECGYYSLNQYLLSTYTIYYTIL